MIEIKPHKIKETSVSVPGSKSYTHRFLIVSALSNGLSSIVNPLKSEDTLLTLYALKKFGITIKEEENIIVEGRAGKLVAPPEAIYLKNSGTSMRLLTALASIGEGDFNFTGTKTLCERPLHDLIQALLQLGVKIRSLAKDGYPPIEIKGGTVLGGKVTMRCDISSQYLSGILLIAPYTEHGIDVTVKNDFVSKPYVDITIDVMKKAGVNVERSGYERFIVKGSQIYKGGKYIVESDCSHAGYFWAAAAINNTSIKVKNINKDSYQGDVKFVKVLEKMGCKIIYENDGIIVSAGAKLTGIEIDMSNMPDMVPTLAVAAAFAEGKTIIKNVGHLTIKESDRLEVVREGLTKMGISVETSKDKMIISGGKPKGAEISVYDDHRIAMSFAIAGLKVEGIIIKDEKCVDKSFPDFWDILKRL